LLRFIEFRRSEFICNGCMNFYSTNYFVLTTIGWISVLNLRFGGEYTDSENFSSLLTVILCFYSVVYPVFIVIFYIKTDKPIMPPIELEEVEIFEINSVIFVEKYGSIKNYLAQYQTPNQRRDFD
jgi:hypothetical protein